MRLQSLWVDDFRNLDHTELSLPPGLLVALGDNGAGKTNLLEAIGYLATLESFRGAAPEAMIRATGEVAATRAVVRGEGTRAGRNLLVEAEIAPSGRSRVRLNRQPVRRAADLDEALLVSVFSPDDLVLVKGGPSGRRRYLDEALAMLHPRHRASRRDFERVLRQRNALLSQLAGRGGRVEGDAAHTLDVWDQRLCQTGEALGAARVALVEHLGPDVGKVYGELASDGAAVIGLDYRPAWLDGGLAAALAAVRSVELRRGVSLVGPHRDELEITIGGLPARTHASQGEQRSLALALRMACHSSVTEAVGEAPLLLLDDVFSELDPARSRALVDNLPPGQAVLTTAGPVPDGVVVDQTVRVHQGRITTPSAAPRPVQPAPDRAPAPPAAPAAPAESS